MDLHTIAASNDPKAREYRGLVREAEPPPGREPLTWRGVIRALDPAAASAAAVTHVLAIAAGKGWHPPGETTYDTRIVDDEGRPHYFHAHVDDPKSAAGMRRATIPGETTHATGPLVEDEFPQEAERPEPRDADAPEKQPEHQRQAAEAETETDDFVVTIKWQETPAGGRVPLDWPLDVVAAEDSDAAIEKAIEDFRAMMPGLMAPAGETTRYGVDVVRSPAADRPSEAWETVVSYTRNTTGRPAPPTSERIH